MGWAGTYFTYVSVMKPQLELAERQLLAAQNEAERTRKDAVARVEKFEKIAKDLSLAKDQFISRVTEAVNDVGALPGSAPNQPVLLTRKVNDEVLVPKARRIVDERNRAREGITQVANNLAHLIQRA
jgi:hypothetical protein